MAKKTNIEDEGIVLEGQDSGDETPVTKETTVTPAAKEPTVAPTVKKVKIRAIEDIDCLISGVPYKVAKDKEASVPSDVAAIMCFSGKAYRL